jgi:hypothetical protein
MKVVSRKLSPARTPQTNNAPFFSKESGQHVQSEPDHTPFFSPAIKEPLLQMKEENVLPDKMEKLQLKTMAAGGSDQPEDNNEASSSIENRISNSKNSGSPLPESVKGNMDHAFGTDFSAVKIHTDDDAVQMNKDLNAKAFTHGNDIYFNEGKYDTGSQTGKHLLAHELTHVVQQESSTEEKSPKIRRSILDDIGEYLSIGWEFFKGIIAGIIEWFGDLFSSIGSLIGNAFSGDVGALLAIAGIIIVIILAVVFPEVVIPILIGLGIAMGFFSMSYFLYMMARPGLSAYERGKYLGKALVEGALMVLTVAEGIRFVQAFAKIARLAEGVGLLQKLRYVRNLLRFGETAKALALLAEIGDIQKTLDLLTIVNDVNKASDLMAIARGAGGVDVLLDVLRIPGVTADDVLEFMHFAGMTLPDLRALARTPGMTLDNLRIILGSQHMTVEILREILGRPTVTVAKLLEVLRTPGMTVPDLRRFLTHMSMDNLQELLHARTMTVEILKELLGKPTVTAENLISLLRRPGMTVSSVRELFSASGMTVERLIELLAVEGMTINELKSLLRQPGMTANILTDILSSAGMTLTDLRDLLARQGITPEILQEILARAGMTVTDLKDLLGLTDDVTQLRTLLNLVPEVAKLKDYFALAGGHGQAVRLLNVLQKAHALGDVARAEDLLILAGGNAQKFTELTSALNQFGLATAPGGAPAALHGYSGINLQHFQARHTFEFFDFAGAIEHNPIKASNTLWPAGTNIPAKVEEALSILDAATPPIRITPFANPPLIVTLSDGTRVQIGCNNANAVGQFFPVPDAAKGIIDFGRTEMQSFKKLLLP